MKFIKLFILSGIISTALGMEEASSNRLPATVKNLPQGIYNYLQNLPRIQETKSNDTADTAYTITQFLCSLSNSKKLIGIEGLAKKIEGYVKQTKPIPFMLVGFPMKSANDEKKVIKSHLDLAEFAGLLSLNHLCKEIGTIYEPGAQLTFYTQEPFIDQMNNIVKDQIGIPLYSEEQEKDYQKQLKQLASHFKPTIKIGQIDGIKELYKNNYATLEITNLANVDHYKAFAKEELDCSKFLIAAQEKLFQQQKAELVQKYQLEDIKTLALLKKKAATDNVYKKKYNHIVHSLPAKKLLATTADKMADCIGKGIIRMRALKHDCIPDYDSYVHLGIRSSEDGDVTKKVGINLVYGSQGTPWHKTLVLDQESASLKSLKELTKNQNSPLHIQHYDIDGLKLGYVNTHNEL